MLCDKHHNNVFGMNSSVEAGYVDFFRLLINVMATNLFSSIIEILGCPDFGASLTKPVLSNL